MIYEQSLAKDTCSMDVSATWNEMRNYGNIIQL